MSNLKYHRLANFFDFALELKAVRRSGWINKVKVTNPESVADHTYSMSIMVMVFSDILGLKTERAMKMAILHDLGESIVGDYEPHEISRGEKESRETEAIDCILNLLPLEPRKEYKNIWKEYLNNKSSIAQLVHGVDKFEMALQARKYESQGYPSHILRRFFISVKNEVNDSDVLHLLERAEDAIFPDKD